MIAMACDFCNGPVAHWRYEAHDVALLVAPQVVVYSEGAWEACDRCHDFIEHHAWEALADDVATRYAAAHLEDDSSTARHTRRAACLAMWEQFRAATFACHRLTEGAE
jgi:hypothetical protein